MASAASVELPRYMEAYPAEDMSAPRVRHCVSLVLRIWALEDLIRDAEVVATELAANAIRHAGGGFLVVLTRTHWGVRIAVSDKCPDMPVTQDTDEDGEGGRGLILVGALAHTWGVMKEAQGKTVWADLVKELP